MLKHVGLKNFSAHGGQIFLSYISKWLAKVERVDFVWDTYLPSSLKASTRAKRGKGHRRHVISAPIPSNWQEFLHVEEKKKELFKSLLH